MVVVVVAIGIYTCSVLSWQTRYQVPEVIILTTITSRPAAAACWWWWWSGWWWWWLLLLVVVVVTRGIYVSLLLKTWCRCRFQVVPRIRHELKDFCADAHRLTSKAISRDFCTTYRDIWVRSLQESHVKKSDTPLSFLSDQAGDKLTPST